MNQAQALADALREAARRAYDMIGNLEMEIGHPMEADFTQLHADLWKALASFDAGSQKMDPVSVEAWQEITDDCRPPHEEVVLLYWQDWSGAEYVEAARFSTGQRFDSGYSNYSQHGYATHWRPVPSTAAIRSLGSQS